MAADLEAPPPPSRDRALVFIGFMGAGKTLAARRAAERLGTEAIDADELVARRLGVSIARCFAERGETAFRAAEEACVGELLERAGGDAVIALGGGALGSERVRAALTRHRAVWLDVDPDVAWARAGVEGPDGPRPLARDRAAFTALHADRAPTYEAAADAIVPAARAEAIAEVLPALAVLERAPARTRLLLATTPSGDYPVYVGSGLLAGGFWPPAPGRRFTVSDRTVAALHGGGLDPIVELEPGEVHKTLQSAERVWRALARAGATRGDHVAALGGGVVGDLAGFCTATYQRGVALVGVPTTLVAQVDSAYGGKTGVDLPEAKNYVGAYHQPAAVVVDLDALRTLPGDELAAGYAEVIKTALLAGGPLWDRVRRGPEHGGPDRDLVVACARYKLTVVAADERDTGARQALNLGHTVGHAIEAATGYGRYRHGEAVALGLLAALRLSDRDALRAEVAELLVAHGLPTRLDAEVDPESVIAAVARDKKRHDPGPVPFVLLDAPGTPRTGCPVAPDALAVAVAELRG